MGTWKRAGTGWGRWLVGQALRQGEVGAVRKWGVAKSGDLSGPPSPSAAFPATAVKGTNLK